VPPCALRAATGENRSTATLMTMSMTLMMAMSIPVQTLHGAVA